MPRDMTGFVGTELLAFSPEITAVALPQSATLTDAAAPAKQKFVRQAKIV